AVKSSMPAVWRRTDLGWWTSTALMRPPRKAASTPRRIVSTSGSSGTVQVCVCASAQLRVLFSHRLQAVVDREGDRRQARVHSELAQDVLDVGADGRDRHAHRVGHVTGGFAADDATQDIVFARGEVIGQLMGVSCAEERGGLQRG